MQQTAVLADLQNVRVVASWIALATSIFAGVHCAHRSDSGPSMGSSVGLDVGVMVAWLACGLLGGAAIVLASEGRRGSASAARAAWWASILLALVLGSLWGFTQGQVLTRPHGHVRLRGPAHGVVSMVVIGAGRSGPRCRFVAIPETVDRVSRAGEVRWWLSAPGELCPVSEGQRIRFRAQDLSPWSAGVHADLRSAAVARTGAARQARLERAWVQDEPSSRYWSWVAASRQRAWALSRGDEAVGLLAAGVLGQVEALPPHRRAQLRRAGLGHLIAVSGLHVGIAAWLTQLILSRAITALGGSPRLAVVCSWLPLLAYVGLTGASAPAVRAAGMVGVLSVGTLVGRPVHGLTVLAVVATLMLALRPSWALDVGFQMSVVAMATLVRSPPGTGLLLSTWRITWALAPLTLWHFGEHGVAGLISNLVAIPLFSVWVLPIGAVGWLLEPALGEAALQPAAWGAHTILVLARTVAAWPAVPRPVIGGLALLLGVAPLLVRAPRWRRLVPPMLGCLATVVVVAWPPSPSILRPRRFAEAPIFIPDPRALESSDWWAIGSSRHPSVVAMVPGQPGLACIDRPAGSPERWPAILQALGVDAVVRVRDRAPATAPHVAALRRELQRAGRWREADVQCRWPEPARVRHSVRACARLGAGVVVVGGSGDDGPVRCHRPSGWWPLGLDSSKVGGGER